jgi:phage baseplate assembly protein W
LAQTPPLTDSVQDTQSDMYQAQLTCSGATAPITWTTVQGTQFLVAPNGQVGTQGSLLVGTYTASGTMQDNVGNTGTWSFTLTVFSLPNPETSVVPTAPLPWTGIEVMVPFHVDPVSGMVATIQDYGTILEQHVLTILMTGSGERVMLPTYGVGIPRHVFDPITQLTAAAIQSNIEEGLAQWEPAVTLLSVDVVPDITMPNLLNITVDFTSADFPGIQSVNLSVGGSYPVVSISQIGPFSP